MYTDIWTKHLQTEDEKKRFISALESAEPVLEVLQKLIDEKIGDLDRSFLSLKQYQETNWPLVAAHKNGMASAFSAVKQLVTIQD
jgi:hypothetical protein